LLLKFHGSAVRLGTEAAISGEPLQLSREQVQGLLKLLYFGAE
jgi:hypothetical protein